MNRSINELFNCSINFTLYDILRNSEYPLNGLYKCKVKYRQDESVISFHTYEKKQLITLLPIEVKDLDYHLKYANRDSLNKLGIELGLNQELLIVKKEMVADTRFTNIICKKQGQWYTPKTPLLKGTQREYLINLGVLKELDITINSIGEYEEIALINAMIPFESRIVIKDVSPMSKIAIK